MTSRRSLLGIGPKLAAWTLPALLVAIAATIELPAATRIPFVPRGVRLASSALLLALGLLLHASSARVLLRDFKKGLLITTGPYGWTQNPLYAAFILFLVPGIALLVDSWPVLALAPWMYAGLKRLIHAEYRELEVAFGTRYRAYRARTSELLPRPPRTARAGRRAHA